MCPDLRKKDAKASQAWRIQWKKRPRLARPTWQWPTQLPLYLWSFQIQATSINIGQTSEIVVRWSPWRLHWVMGGILWSTHRLLYYPEEATNYYIWLKHCHERREEELIVIHRSIHSGCGRCRRNQGGHPMLDLRKWPLLLSSFSHQAGWEKGTDNSGYIEPNSGIHNVGRETDYLLRQPGLDH